MPRTKVVKRKAAKPAPKPAPKPAAPAVDDILDTRPTPAIPGVYYGVYHGVQRRAALAYKRDERSVWTIMFSENGGQRVVVKWGVDDFDANMRRAHHPHLTGPIYTVARAVHVFLQPGALYTEEAYRVLSKLARGQDPDVEDTLDDLLDMTPSKVPPMHRARKRSPIAKQDRKAKRHAKLAAMTPAELRAWRDKRNARRKLRRLNAKKQGVKK